MKTALQGGAVNAIQNVAELLVLHTAVVQVQPDDLHFRVHIETNEFAKHHSVSQRHDLPLELQALLANAFEQRLRNHPVCGAKFVEL